LPALIAPLIAGKPNPASNPMIEITTSNSTNVNELLFAFGNFRDEVKVMVMTTPALPHFHQNKNGSSHAFTLIELLAVITIIGILAGLTLGAAGAVRRHGATSTAKAEVAALQAACDRYYADNNAYPIGTDNPATASAPTGATNLFTNLLGSVSLTNAPTGKRYFEPKPAMVSTNRSPNHFIDPWGYAYGYNCTTNTDGTWNPPLIWSTAGQTTAAGTNKWITSWPKM
jgi:prepilin-type N-terminal cleavage/methylation domain-containing protein